jgi:hypothetical protein
MGDFGSIKAVFYLSRDNIFIIFTDINIIKAVAYILGIDLKHDILTLSELIILGD